MAGVEHAEQEVSGTPLDIQEERHPVSGRVLHRLLADWVLEPMQCLEYQPAPNMENSCSSPEEQNSDWEAWLERLSLVAEDLEELLASEHAQFWCHVLFDPSVLRCVDSYLRSAPRPHEALRWPDNSVETLHRACVAAHERVHRLVFLVCVRMSTHRESATAHFTPHVFAELIYEHWVMDAPRILDVCALYGVANGQLVSRLLQNLFRRQPQYRQDLHSALGEVLRSVFNRLRVDVGLPKTSVGSFSQPQDVEEKTLSGNQVRDLLLYMWDVAETVTALLRVYPAAAQLCVDAGTHETLAALYEDMVPFVRRQLLRPSLPDASRSALRKQLVATRARLLRAVRRVLHAAALAPFFEQVALEDGSSQLPHIDAYLRLLADLLAQRRFVLDFEQRWPLRDDVHVLRQVSSQHASLVVDESLVDYLEGSVALVYDELGPSTRRKPVSASLSENAYANEPGFAAGGDVEATDGLDSLVSAVLDLLPDQNPLLVRNCLRHMNFDTEAVVNSLLEGSVPVEVLLLEDPQSAQARDAINTPLLATRRGVFDGDELDVLGGSADPAALSQRVHQGKKALNLDEVALSPAQREELFREYDQVSDWVADGAGEDATGEDLYNDEYDDTYDAAANVSALPAAWQAARQKDVLHQRPVVQPSALAALERGAARNEKIAAPDSDDEEGERVERQLLTPEERRQRDLQRQRFCEDPALVRARREAAWAARGRGRGAGRGGRGQAPPPAVNGTATAKTPVAESAAPASQPASQPAAQRDVRGRSRGQGQTKEVTANRRNKAEHKASRGNHNRRGGHDHKMRGGMF